MNKHLKQRLLPLAALPLSLAVCLLLLKGLSLPTAAVDATELARIAAVSAFTHTLEMGIYLTMFLIHLLLFIILRSYRPNLYFAVFCLMWFLRAGVTGPEVFFTLLPAMNWYIQFRIEHLSVPVAAMLTVALVYDLFPGILPRSLMRIWFVLPRSFLPCFCLPPPHRSAPFPPAIKDCTRW